MSTMSLRLPESLHERAREIAKKEGVSINQLVATALAEKLSALDTLEYLEARADRGSREAFLEVLSRVPDAAPTPGDEEPEE
ncbi:MAG: toxin-antitoxin system HicB family antitoxin [Gemmatimonadota bacterium]